VGGSAATGLGTPGGDAAGRLVTRAARELANDPRLIASALTAYQVQTGWSEQELAGWLGLSVGGLHQLALCTRPDAPAPEHRHILRGIARYIGCDADHLQRVLWGAGGDAPGTLPA
jgi:hypothetical protein